MSDAARKTQHHQGRHWPWRRIFGAAALLVLGGTLYYYFQPFTAKATAVSVETITSGPVTRVLAVNGRIAAMHSVNVRSSVSGTLAALPIAEGADVRLGDVLARINPAGQEAVVRQTRASLDAGRVAETLANANYNRLASLKGVVTRTAIETAASNARSAAEDVRRLAALYDQAEIELAKFTVRAPISGTVLSIDAEPGQLIDPAKALITLADLDLLIVETDVDEAYSNQIKVGMPALLKLVGESKTRNGTVHFVARNVDAATGGMAIKIRFDEAVSASIGLTVTMNIVVDTQDTALSVPRAAIVRAITGSSVFVVSAGIAVRQPVTVVEWPSDRLIVSGGLTIGDVVIADATSIVEGQRVEAASLPVAPTALQPAAGP